MSKKKYLPYVFYGIANPVGEHFSENTTFLDSYQIEQFVNQSHQFRIPIHIEHIVQNNKTNSKILPSGHTVAAKVDQETKGLGVYFMLYDDKNGNYAFDIMTKGTDTGGLLFQELSIGAKAERLVPVEKSDESEIAPVAASNDVQEISIVNTGDRPLTKIKGYISYANPKEPTVVDFTEKNIAPQSKLNITTENFTLNNFE